MCKGQFRSTPGAGPAKQEVFLEALDEAHVKMCPLASWKGRETISMWLCLDSEDLRATEQVMQWKYRIRNEAFHPDSQAEL